MRCGEIASSCLNVIASAARQSMKQQARKDQFALTVLPV
jgi:hypothetical protein